MSKDNKEFSFSYLYLDMQNPSLKIYHASAGTGKTFALVKDYLVRVLSDERSFRHILAVTFTNKATTEMKERILRVLYGLSRAGLPDHRQEWQVQEALLYLRALPEHLQGDMAGVRKRAARALRHILYEYPSFSVQTIDSFFQRVLRGFARELNLPFSYDMEFDEDLVLEEITGMLLMHAADDKDLLGWLVRMIEEMGDDTGTWDIKKILLQQGRDIFTEAFKSLPPETLKQLTERSFVSAYLRDLSGRISAFEKEMQQLGERGLEIFSKAGVDENAFAYKKSGVAAIFRHLARGTHLRRGIYPFGSRFADALGDPGKWLSKENAGDPDLTALVDDHLQPLILEIYTCYENHYRDYYTARVIRNRLHVLGVMADLRQQLFRWMNDNNRLLMSETGTFLHEIIGEDEIPFIYEKLGQHYNHYMIDEFQDTSRVQYENLLPLLKNSMASGGSSLIVGDIKQSLYRWRNGDWEIMHGDIHKDLSPGRSSLQRLSVNYRSREEIVRFNNAFFIAAGEEVWKMYRKGLGDVVDEDDALMKHQKATLADIYAPGEVIQQVPAGAGGGYVAIHTVSGDDERGWGDEALERTALLIDDLLGREGWAPGEVMVLVRSNRDGREVVRYLLTRQQERRETAVYPVVSQDSLYLAASPVVRFLVAFMKYMADPEDMLNFSELWYLCERLEQGGGMSTLPAYHLQELEKMPSSTWITLLPGGADAAWLSRLMSQPLPEVMQELVSRYHLDEHRYDVPFLHTFQNYLTDFVNREGSDGVAFLEWWKDEGWSRSVQLPEEVDAVRVMTIHKAKGLGVPVVIMPLAAWEFEKKGGGYRKVLWCRPDTAPFDRAPLVPVEYSGMLLMSRFAGDFMRERFSAYLDNLNLLYVAFTRARERLYVFTPAGNSGISSLILDTLGQLHREMPEVLEKPPRLVHDEEIGAWTTGTPLPPGTSRRKEGSEVDGFPAGKALHRLRIAGKGREYFLLGRGGYRERIDRGNLYHTILAGVVTATDVEDAVRKAVRAGLVRAGEEERLIKEVRGFINQEEARAWFSGTYAVKREADIILPGGRTLRPDRVMIRDDEAIIVDYKFGEVEEEAYVRQVKRYMEVMKAMGYARVSGVVWYVMLQKMIRVDD